MISLIVPTQDRSLLLRHALLQIERQTIDRELEVIIVDGGTRRKAWLDAFTLLDAPRELGGAPRRWFVRHVRISPEASIGACRNLGVHRATGEIIVHWDDDDCYHPTYLEELLSWFETTPVDIGGLYRVYHYDFLLRRGWQSNLWEKEAEPYGATMIYRKKLWKHVGGFPDQRHGEDSALIERFRAHGFTCRAMLGTLLHVYIRHNRNKGVESIIDADQTKAARAALRDQLDFYDDLSELVSVPGPLELGPQFHLPAGLRRL